MQLTSQKQTITQLSSCEQYFGIVQQNSITHRGILQKLY